MLERLIEQHPEHTVMLEVQHRMHEAIMSAGNARFYSGRLGPTPRWPVPRWKASAHGFGWTPQDVALRSDVPRREERVQPGRGVVCPRPGGGLAEHASIHDVGHRGALRRAGRTAQRDVARPHGRGTSGWKSASDHPHGGWVSRARAGWHDCVHDPKQRPRRGGVFERESPHPRRPNTGQTCVHAGGRQRHLGSDGYLGWLLEHAQEQEAYDSAWSWMA